MTDKNSSVAALATGGIAAILASACCLGPLLLVSLGLSGAWIGQLQVLEPYRPYTVAVAVIALFFAYRRIFRPLAACAPGDLCAVPRTRRAYKAMFWFVAVLVVVAIAYPYVVPFLI
jgi:mercuric ion transport protein